MQVFSVSLFKIIALFDFTEKNMIYFVIIFSENWRTTYTNLTKRTESPPHLSPHQRI